MGNLIERRRPDMIIIDKIRKRKKAQTVDFTVPADPRIEITQKRKIENYQDLKRELQKLWNLKTSTVAVVIGALETIPYSLKKHLNQLNAEVNISLNFPIALYYKGFTTSKSIAIKQKQLLNILHQCVLGRLLLSVFRIVKR